MHWFLRIGLAFLLMLLVFTGVDWASSRFVDSSFNKDLLTQVWETLAIPLFLLVYWSTPRLMSDIPQATRPAPRRPGHWLANPLWKWALLVFIIAAHFLCGVGRIIQNWQIQDWVSTVSNAPAPDGFPTRLSPAARDFLSKPAMLPWLKLTLTPFGILVGYLFWRDWRTPKRPTNLCAECDYNLTGNVSGICPECGRRI